MQGNRGAALRAVATGVLCAVLTWSAAPQLAWAQAPDAATVRRAEALATEAKLLFQQKAYEQAAERFFEAYTLVRKPALIYNAARAYEEAGNVERAVALFKAYQGLPDAPKDGKAEAKRRLIPLEAELGRRQAAAAAKEQAEAARKAAEAKAAAAKARAEQQETERARQDRVAAEREAAEAARKRAEAERKAREQLQSRKRPIGTVQAAPERGLPWAPIGATAGAAIVSGVFFALAFDEADAARTMEGNLRSDADKQEYLGHADAARRNQAIAWGAGVVTVGAAGWLVWTLLQEDAPRAALLPAPQGAQLLVRF
ncbi:MAG: hypothetical protein H6747_15705 [Deltaproteobacteria bacterium]|nr:hypothetical protein [Deltaproteobacteria bacterium]